MYVEPFETEDKKLGSAVVEGSTIIGIGFEIAGGVELCAVYCENGPGVAQDSGGNASVAVIKRKGKTCSSFFDLVMSPFPSKDMASSILGIVYKSVLVIGYLLGICFNAELSFCAVKLHGMHLRIVQ